MKRSSPVSYCSCLNALRDQALRHLLQPRLSEQTHWCLSDASQLSAAFLASPPSPPWWSNTMDSACVYVRLMKWSFQLVTRNRCCTPLRAPSEREVAPSPTQTSCRHHPSAALQSAQASPSRHEGMAHTARKSPRRHRRNPREEAGVNGTLVRWECPHWCSRGMWFALNLPSASSETTAHVGRGFAVRTCWRLHTLRPMRKVSDWLRVSWRTPLDRRTRKAQDGAAEAESPPGGGAASTYLKLKYTCLCVSCSAATWGRPPLHALTSSALRHFSSARLCIRKMCGIHGPPRYRLTRVSLPTRGAPARHMHPPWGGSRGRQRRPDRSCLSAAPRGPEGAMARGPASSCAS